MKTGLKQGIKAFCLALAVAVAFGAVSYIGGYTVQAGSWTDDYSWLGGWLDEHLRADESEINVAEVVRQGIADGLTPAEALRPTINAPTTGLGNGQLFWADGVTFFGGWRWPEGIRFSGPLTYIGDWWEVGGQGVPIGYGTYIWENGHIYQGRVYYGVPHHGQHGTMLYPDGFMQSWYVGEWNLGEPHGLGMMGFESGLVFEGRFVGGWPAANGSGLWYFANGDSWEGYYSFFVTEDEWRFVRDGQGLMTFANGGRISGVVQNGQFIGEVGVSFPNGDHFRGGWDTQNGRPYGSGVMVANGQRQEGTWDSDGVFTARPVTPQQSSSGTDLSTMSMTQLVGLLDSLRLNINTLRPVAHVSPGALDEIGRLNLRMQEVIAEISRRGN